MKTKRTWMLIGAAIVLLIALGTVLFIRWYNRDTWGITPEYIEKMLAGGTRVGKEETFMGGRFQIYADGENYLAVTICDTDESEWSRTKIVTYYGYQELTAEEYYKKYGSEGSWMTYLPDKKVYTGDGEYYETMGDPTYTQKVKLLYACEKWIIAWRMNEEQYQVFLQNKGLDFEGLGEEGFVMSAAFFDD